jgi:hypothetical protein
VRAIATLIIVLIALLPSLYAGWPGVAPGWFDARQWGVPVSVLAMSGLMAVLIVLAAVCSAIARSSRDGAE